jgi:hypothetical protein
MRTNYEITTKYWFNAWKREIYSFYLMQDSMISNYLFIIKFFFCIYLVLQLWYEYFTNTFKFNILITALSYLISQWRKYNKLLSILLQTTYYNCKIEILYNMEKLNFGRISIFFCLVDGIQDNFFWKDEVLFADSNLIGIHLIVTLV